MVVAKSPSKCRGCGEGMEAGYALDAGMGPLRNPNYRPQVWIPGSPKKGFAGGLDVPSVKLSRGFRIDAWRCAACGLLEFYATQSLRA